jgi:putative Ca2+/H+ antiporter (TMEM165/GDT1 family)
MTMNWGLWALFFGSLFAAELPDKTSIVVMTLAARGPLRVWVGAALGLVAQAAIAVAAGALLARVGGPWLHWGEAAVFVVFGLVMWSHAGGDDDDAGRAQQGWSLMASAFVLVFLAEFGDLTQLALVAWSARLHPAWLVWAVASLALAGAALVSALAGAVLARAVGSRRLKQASGLLFCVIGVVMAVL